MRVEAYGTMDEILCSLLGLVVAEMKSAKNWRMWWWTVKKSSNICLIAERSGNAKGLRPYKQEAEMVEFWKRIDRYMEKLPKLESFIIPGGHKVASMLHQCRTVARRLERRMVAVLENGEAVNPIGRNM